MHWGTAQQGPCLPGAYSLVEVDIKTKNGTSVILKWHLHKRNEEFPNSVTD